MTDRLLTLEEVGKLIHLSPASIRTYRVTHPERVPPFKKFNERLVMLESELNKWLKGRYGGAV